MIRLSDKETWTLRALHALGGAATPRQVWQWCATRAVAGCSVLERSDNGRNKVTMRLHRLQRNLWVECRGRGAPLATGPSAHLWHLTPAGRDYVTRTLQESVERAA